MTTSGDDVEYKVQVGPDLNSSKSPLDKKLYRQIIMENGLRAVLISDTVAMNQGGPFLYEEDDDESMEVDSENDEEGKSNEGDEEEDDDDEEEEDDGLRKAATSIVVGAGSYYDPPWAQGIAHFLEHMLFMGTSKYPKENEYDAFLSKNGGSDNAYTELEHTMYHFEICQEKLPEALDMLANFFIDPLMLQDAVDREIQSIESEFQLSKNSDDCRLQQLLCHVCDLQNKASNGEEKSPDDTDDSDNINFDLQKHPFATFSWGNMDSLKLKPKQHGIEIMNELRNFYNQHYYAQNIGLVIVGAYTLDELEKQVTKCFSAVPALPRSIKNTASEHEMYAEKRDTYYKMRQISRENPASFHVKASTPIEKFGMPFQPESLGTIYRIVPVKDKHNLTITWQIPPQWNNWKSKPCDYIAHLIGHEASGSLLSVLKDKLWVNACYAGVGSDGKFNVLFPSSCQFLISEPHPFCTSS